MRNASLLAYPPYVHEEGLKYLFIAVAGYCAPPAVAAWDCVPCAKADRAIGGRGLSVRAVFRAGGVEFRGFLATAPGLIVVSFRGSETLLDYLLDINVQRAAPYPGCDDCRAHSGFLDAWRALNASVGSAVLAAVADDPGANLILTGHSLGGALALLAALDLHLVRRIAPTAVYTFGAPRVGNPALARFYAARAAAGQWASWRVVHRHDVVPHLPPHDLLAFWLGRFAHAPREVWYDSSADPHGHTTCAQDDGEDPGCSRGLPFWRLSVKDHYRYLGEAAGDAACVAAAA